jgi:peptide-methionine (S)-S-oxide reductase
VIRTRVGYAGGTTENPTYHRLGDHTESIQIDYDPAQISYEELLNEFWKGHSPTSQPLSRQYASFIFYHNETQKELAVASLAQEEAQRQKQIYTEIVPAGTFYRAEAYHQKYRLRNTRSLMEEFNAVYPNDKDFVDSTAAARVNGYLGRYGSCEQFRTEMDDLILSSKGLEQLERITCP